MSKTHSNTLDLTFYILGGILVVLAIIYSCIKLYQTPSRKERRSHLRRLIRRIQKDYDITDGPSVTVTTTTQHAASPQVNPPYPIDVRHPTPATNAPGLGFNASQPPYPVRTPNMPFPQGPTPYPPAGPTPYRPTGVAPYPPATNDYSANPPPYDVAVSQAPINPPRNTKEVYGKQSPYNPGYN